MAATLVGSALSTILVLGLELAGSHDRHQLAELILERRLALGL